jgi:hypothetical protein
MMRSEFWRRTALAAALTGVVIFSSVVLVRYRNRDRAMTTAVEGAFESLRALPDSVVTPFCSKGEFLRGIDEYQSKVRTGEVPVDTVRAFYADFTLAARDGRWRGREVARLGRHLGLTGKTITLDPDTPAQGSGDSSAITGEGN